MAELTSRERVKLALEHKETDRIPFDLGTTCFTSMHWRVADDLNALMGTHQDKYEFTGFSAQVIKLLPELRDRFHVDTVCVSTKGPSNFKLVIDENDSFVDEWGITYRRAPGAHQYDFTKHPLEDADIEAMLEYPFPDPVDDGRFEGFKEEVKRLYEKTDKAIILTPPINLQISGLGQWLTGFPRFYMDTVIDQEFLHALYRRLLDWYKRWLDRALDEVGKYINVISSADDLGIQTGPMINPETYREIHKPYQKELFDYIKQGTDAKIFYHCCGSCSQFLDDLIEVGVDILNPIQVTAVNMETDMLKAGWGDKLSFWGGGCAAQTVLANGTVDDVRAEVRKRVADLKPGGGFVFAPIHNILPGVSAEKVVAMYDTAYECGWFNK